MKPKTHILLGVFGFFLSVGLGITFELPMLLLWGMLSMGYYIAFTVINDLAK